VRWPRALKAIRRARAAAWFAAGTDKRKPRFLLVDTTEMTHRVADDMMAWPDKEIISRYNSGGVT
jgi:hypothetical protein